MASISDGLIAAALELRDRLDKIPLSAPVACAYNPLHYAWSAHEAYLRAFGNSRKRIIFLGMNPGPFGMVQTGVPFGEVKAVANWMGIRTPIGQPARVHPKRPVTGFECTRSEVSGKRLWGLFAQRFGTAKAFFKDHFVLNYCPLALFAEQGTNLTPDKLPASQAQPLFDACNAHLAAVVEILKPGFLIGVGDFAEKRARSIPLSHPVTIGRILHPSPASPAANRDWAGQATAQMTAMGAW